MGCGQPGAVGDARLIQISPQLRILVAIEAIDRRKGIDSLGQLCREKLDADPFPGLFPFRRALKPTLPTQIRRSHGTLPEGHE